MTQDRFDTLCSQGTAEAVAQALAAQPQLVKGAPVPPPPDDLWQSQPLHLACRNEKHGLEIARLLLVAGADVNAREKDGDVPLMGAAGNEKHSAELFRLLIAVGADVNAANEDGRTALHYACENRQWEAAALLIAAGANVNATTEDQKSKFLSGITPLLEACGHCDSGGTECVRLLLEAGADPNRTGGNGETPLMTSCACGDQECVDLLLAAGASLDANGNDKGGVRLFINACCGGLLGLVKRLSAALDDPALDKNRLLYDVCNSARITSIDIHNDTWDKERKPTQSEMNASLMPYVEIARMLIGAGADVNTHAAGLSDQNTPLIAAAQSDSEDLVRLLLSAGAKVDDRNFYGETPLILACGEHSLSSVRLMLEAGADIEAENCKCATPLIMAAAEGCDEIVLYLLEHGARLDHYASDDGEFPFMSACRCCKVETIKALLPPGFHTEMCGWWNRTALHYAASGNNVKAVEFLLGLGADIDARDKNGYTPIMAAIEDYGWDTAPLLVRHGANLKARREYGNAVLMQAVENRQYKTIISIIGQGAGVNDSHAKGEDRTPLMTVLKEYGDLDDEEYSIVVAMLRADPLVRKAEHCRKARERIDANDSISDEHKEQLKGLLKA